MYGKTLEADFPERFDEFLDEFKTTSPDVLNEAFRLARGVCTEFPTPADVRKQIVNVQVPRERIEAAHDRLRQRLASQPTPKMLKSVLDEEKPIPREVIELSEDEKIRRLKALLKQAEDMKTQ